MDEMGKNPNNPPLLLNLETRPEFLENKQFRKREPRDWSLVNTHTSREQTVCCSWQTEDGAWCAGST